MTLQQINDMSVDVDTHRYTVNIDDTVVEIFSFRKKCDQDEKSAKIIYELSKNYDTCIRNTLYIRRVVIDKSTDIVRNALESDENPNIVIGFDVASNNTKSLYIGDFVTDFNFNNVDRNGYVQFCHGSRQLMTTETNRFSYLNNVYFPINAVQLHNINIYNIDSFTYKAFFSLTEFRLVVTTIVPVFKFNCNQGFYIEYGCIFPNYDHTNTIMHPNDRGVLTGCKRKTVE